MEFHQWMESKDIQIASKMKYSRSLMIIPKEYGYIILNDWFDRIDTVSRIKIKHDKMKIDYTSSSGKKKKYSYRFVPVVKPTPESSHRAECDIYASPELRQCRNCPYRQ